MLDENNVERNKLNAEGKIVYDLLNDHKEFSLDQQTIIDARTDALYVASDLLKGRALSVDNLDVETLKLAEKFTEYIFSGVI